MLEAEVHPSLKGHQVDIVVKSTIPLELVVDNVKICQDKNYPRFADLPNLGKGTGPIAIVGGGPSLSQELEKLRNFPGPIIGCGSVHDYLIDNNIYPTYHALADPDEAVTKFLKKPAKGVIYLVASQCHPKTFEALEGFDIRVWHAFICRDGDGSIPEGLEFDGEPVIPGGGFIIGRAWPIGAVLGYRNFHFFGFDCSFPIDCKDQHAYPYAWDREEPCWVVHEQTGERFASTVGWMVQLNSFMKLLSLTAGRFDVTVHGHSLAASMLHTKV